MRFYGVSKNYERVYDDIVQVNAGCPHGIHNLRYKTPKQTLVVVHNK